MISLRSRIVGLAFLLVIGAHPSIPASHALGEGAAGPMIRTDHQRSNSSLNVSDNDIFSHQRAISGESSPPAGQSIVALLRDDIAYLLRQPDFYLVIGGLSTVPEHIEYEPKASDRRWMRTLAADRFFEAGETMGDAAVPLALALVSYSGGKIFGSQATVSFASDLFRSNMINALLTSAMKVSINRKRPDGAPYAFPSGHTSHAFATAGVIRHHFGPWLGSAAHLMATYIGVSRLQENKHYLSDVIAGAMLGSYVSYKISHRSGSSAGLGIIPVIENSTLGLGLNVDF